MALVADVGDWPRTTIPSCRLVPSNGQALATALVADTEQSIRFVSIYGASSTFKFEFKFSGRDLLNPTAVVTKAPSKFEQLLHLTVTVGITRGASSL
jgi:hypothetical protein